jgi:hypothetical protein
MEIHLKLQFILLLECSLIFSALAWIAESENLKAVLLFLQFLVSGAIYIFVQRLK